MKINFKSLKRITGISCPIFGISWNPKNTDRDIIKNFLTFLEDRRVLYNPYVLEMPPWVSESIIEIRKKITEIIPDFSEKSESFAILRTMRSACRRYLDETFKYQKQNYMNRFIIKNLFELRSVFGLSIGKLSIMYGIDLDKNLTDIIPVTSDEDNMGYIFDKKKYKLVKKK